MYEGRPDRYFDNLNDNRNAHSTHDHQFTREVFLYKYLFSSLFLLKLNTLYFKL